MNAIRQKTFKAALNEYGANQTTIRERVQLSGPGVHCNKNVNLTLHPAEAGAGIVFLQTAPGGEAGNLISADWSQVTMTELCTVIGNGDKASVSTIEHLMSAIAGLGIDNLLVELDGPEVPILDGSSVQFVEALDEAGVVQQTAPRRYLKILKPVRVDIGRGYAELLPADLGFELEVEIDFECGAIGNQKHLMMLEPGRYREEISKARTFGFISDVERLWKAGFALGASLENTVALDGERVLNPEGLRYSDEFVRHKTLDAIGDLALAGAPIIGRYRSYCGGHKMNYSVLAELFNNQDAYSFVNAPVLSTQNAAQGAGASVSATIPALAPEVH